MHDIEPGTMLPSQEHASELRESRMKILGKNGWVKEGDEIESYDSGEPTRERHITAWAKGHDVKVGYSCPASVSGAKPVRQWFSGTIDGIPLSHSQAYDMYNSLTAVGPTNMNSSEAIAREDQEKYHEQIVDAEQAKQAHRLMAEILY